MRTAPDRRLWILVALAAAIVVMVVAIVAINASEEDASGPSANASSFLISAPLRD